MKNRHETQGDITVIYLDRRIGSAIPAIVSSSRVSELSEFPYKWVAAWRESTQSYYVLSRIKDKRGVWRTVYLHRFLNNPRKNEDVDHWDRDSLNNLDDNLRNVHRKTNNKNRRPNGSVSREEWNYYEKLQNEEQASAESIG
jgi:hypothetical protein